MERVGRVELRDLQLGRLLDAPCPVYPHFIEILIKYFNKVSKLLPPQEPLDWAVYSVYVLFLLDRLASLPL